MVTHIARVMDQPGKVANPTRGQLNRENEYFLSPFAPENLVSHDGFGSPVPRQPAHLHTQAESGAYSRDFSRVPRRRPFIYLKPPYAIGSVPSLSGHDIAYRWPGIEVSIILVLVLVHSSRSGLFMHDVSRLVHALPGQAKVSTTCT